MNKSKPCDLERDEDPLTRFYRMEPYYDAALFVSVLFLVSIMARDLFL